MDAKKVLVSDSGGKMTVYEGVWWQNEGYRGLNFVYLLLDASYTDPDEGKRRVSLARAYLRVSLKGLGRANRD